MDIENGMSFFIATDGFPNQLDGEKQKPLGTKTFKKLLIETSRKPFQMQQHSAH
ncbi:MAG: hypothetical protein GY754_47385 [bacterium]|nr:hypothetical protein [bacterium]